MTTLYDNKTCNEDKNILTWSEQISDELMTKILLEQGGDNQFNIKDKYKKFMSDKLKNNENLEEEKQNKKKMENMSLKQKKRFLKQLNKEKKEKKKRNNNKKYQNIINNNNLNKENEQLKKDQEKILHIKNTFLNQNKYNSDINNIINIEKVGEKVNSMETKTGRIETLTCFLNYYYDIFKKYNKGGDLMILTYLTLSHEKLPENKNKSINLILKNIQKLLRNINDLINKKKLKLVPIQMKFLHKFLSPLNPLEENSKKLDPWQSKVFEHMNDNKNILVCAKTSSGKTVCTTYLAHINKRIIYINPTAELSRQVAGMFRSQLKGNVMLLSHKEKFNDCDLPQVIVGTPVEFESYFTEKGKNASNWIKQFDYFVFDEIHNLNSNEGDALERLISIIPEANAKMIALSATIGNIQQLKGFLEKKLNQKFELITYFKRFIIQQKWIYNNNKLEQLHPLAAFDFDDICNNFLLNTDLSATSEDSYKLFKSLIKYFPEFKKKIDPEEFFKNKKKPIFLSLDDTREYEEFLKKFFTDLCINSKEKNNTDSISKIINILNEFKPIKYENNDSNKDLYKICRKLLNSDKLPAIIFTKDEESIINTFKNFIKNLKKMEKEKYPFYNSDRILIKKIYDEQENLILDIDQKIDPSDDQRDKYNDKIEEIKNDSLNKMKNKMTLIINRRIKNLDLSYEEDKKSFNIKLEEAVKSNNKNEIEKLNLNIKQIENDYNFYVKLYTNDLNNWLSWPTIKNINEYVPHSDFTFNKKGLDINTTRNLKRELRKELHNINYEHIFIQGLERGVLPYFKSLNISFQRKVQKLFYSNFINIIFSDDSLGYGIDMPIRTVCILGEMTELQRTQMSGRSGRRGRDREGHIVFINTDWKCACKGIFEKIIGNKPLNDTIALPVILNIPPNIYKLQCSQTLEQYCNNIEKENQYKLVRSKSKKEGFLKKENYHLALVCYKLRHILTNKVLSLKLLFEYLNLTDLSNNDNNCKKIFSIFCALYDNKIDDNNKLILDEDFIELFNKYKRESKYYKNIFINKSNDLLMGIVNKKFICDDEHIYSKVIRIEKIANIVRIIHNEIDNDNIQLKIIFKSIFKKIKNLITLHQF
jgi:superfamily II RNA helicase